MAGQRTGNGRQADQMNGRNGRPGGKLQRSIIHASPRSCLETATYRVSVTQLTTSGRHLHLRQWLVLAETELSLHSKTAAMLR
jgi:hypothetical protein